MTTVYQVVYETVSSAKASASDPDTTITLLTTISTTTFEPFSTLYESVTTPPASIMESSTESSKHTSSSSLTSSLTASRTSSSLKTTSASVGLTETVTEPGSSTSGTKLGLAIGIPLAVVSLFVFVALVWVFLRKKIRSKSAEYLTYDVEEAAGGNATFERRKPRPVAVEKSQELEEKPPRFLSRLSRMVNPEWISSLDLKSPAFMKSFNLKKEDPETDKDLVTGYKAKRPPSLDLSKKSNHSSDTVSSDTRLVVSKSHTKMQPGELTVVVGDLAVMNFHKGSQVHISLLNREGYGLVPIECLRKY